MSVASARPAAAALTIYAPLERFRAWFDAAKPGGHPVIYAVTPQLEQHPTVVLVRELALADKLLIWSEESKDQPGFKIYRAKRRPDPPRTSYPAGKGSADPLDNPEFCASAAGRVYAMLAECAARGLECPSNGELAEALGFEGREQGRYQFKALVRAGLIRVIEPNRYSARVIEIVASGKRTASASRGVAA